MTLPKVWTEREPGTWTDCTYSAVLMVLVYAGKTEYPLGIYTGAERNALESSDDRPDGQGATFRDTDVAVRRRYGVTMHSPAGGRINTAGLRQLLQAPGRAYALAGLNAKLPRSATNWDTGFAGAHAVCVIPNGKGGVLWLDPLAPAGFAGQTVPVEEVLTWAAALNGDSHDPRFMTENALAPPPPPPAPAKLPRGIQAYAVGTIRASHYLRPDPCKAEGLVTKGDERLQLFGQVERPTCPYTVDGVQGTTYDYVGWQGFGYYVASPTIVTRQLTERGHRLIDVGGDVGEALDAIGAAERELDRAYDALTRDDEGS